MIAIDFLFVFRKSNQTQVVIVIRQTQGCQMELNSLLWLRHKFLAIIKSSQMTLDKLKFVSRCYAINVLFFSELPSLTILHDDCRFDYRVLCSSILMSRAKQNHKSHKYFFSPVFIIKNQIFGRMWLIEFESVMSAHQLSLFRW